MIGEDGAELGAGLFGAAGGGKGAGEVEARGVAVGKGAHLRRTIVDRYNIIPAGLQLGLDPEADRERYRVDASGLVVVPRGGRREFLWNTESP